jgi:uncharacterized protein YciI
MSGHDTGPAQKLAGKIFYLLFWELTDKPGDRMAYHQAHLDYAFSLEKDGRLMSAGPFLNEQGVSSGRGMFMLNVASAEEAHAIAKADPYYKAGYRTYRLETWRRSEGTFTLKFEIGANRVTFV